MMQSGSLVAHVAITGHFDVQSSPFAGPDIHLSIFHPHLDAVTVGLNLVNLAGTGWRTVDRQTPVLWIKRWAPCHCP